MQTRPIEAIFITPGAEIAVMERGGSWQKLHGKGNRCLILGLAALPGLKMTAFKSILAHEYGHFSNRDTAGGNLANQTNRSMYQMALTLAENGLTSWYNPAWWFLRGFNAVFLRVTLGASRLQEILADRIAVLSFGVKSFITGLTHVIRQDLSFQVQLSQAWEKNADTFIHSKNLYALPPIDSDVQKQEIETKLSEILNRPSSTYDSHPAPCERFKLVEKLDCEDVEEEDLAEVIRLLSDAEELQGEMTAIIQKNFGFRQISTASP